MHFAESSGRSLKPSRSEKAVHHLRIFRAADAGEDADSGGDSSRWILETHGCERDSSPRSAEIDDGELLDLICEHILGKTLKGRRRLPKGPQGEIVLEGTDNYE